MVPDQSHIGVIVGILIYFFNGFFLISESTRNLCYTDVEAEISKPRSDERKPICVAVQE